MRRLLILIALSVTWPRNSQAQPDWTRQTDRADPTGHTFICTGTGANDVAALSAAYGSCNEKICRVCGVDAVKTAGTLVERCTRLRKGEPPVQYKHVDCGPRGCRAWIQVFYAKATEAAECPRADSEGFTDPRRCEADIDAFHSATGHSVASFQVRRDALNRALVDCQGIDVRPTPALTALAAKLDAGLDRFVTQERPGPQANLDGWELYAHVAEGWREELRLTKTLIAQIQKIRDVVQDRFLVFAVLEAGQARDLDSPAGIKRLLAAMQACPPGARFGALDDVTLAVLRRLAKAKTATTSIRDHVLNSYSPEALSRPGGFMDGSERIAAFFASDGKISPQEWDFVMKAHRKVPCQPCLEHLIAAPDHGTDKQRLEHILAAQDSLAPIKPLHVDRPPPRADHLLPVGDPAFLLRIEGSAPERVRRQLDAKSWDAILGGTEGHVTPKLRAQVAQRLAKALLHDPTTEDQKVFCDKLQKRIARVAQEKIVVGQAKARMCWCVKGAYAKLSDRYLYKRQMLERTADLKPPCR